MKLTGLIFTALLAIASAEAAATPNAKAIEAYCNSPGQPCDNLKRAASAVASANAEPHRAEHPHCYRVGEPCYKAKRDVLAMAAAVADVHAALEPEPAPDASAEYCNGADGPCAKVKRAAEAIAQLAKAPEEKRSPNAEPHRAQHPHCYRVGEPCYKRKRALEDLAAAVVKI